MYAQILSYVFAMFYGMDVIVLYDGERTIYNWNKELGVHQCQNLDTLKFYFETEQEVQEYLGMFPVVELSEVELKKYEIEVGDVVLEVCGTAPRYYRYVHSVGANTVDHKQITNKRGTAYSSHRPNLVKVGHIGPLDPWAPDFYDAFEASEETRKWLEPRKL